MSDSFIDLSRYSIEELSALTGVTRRNIRFYVVSELIPAPEGWGPSATYRRTHLVRLRAIKHLRERRWSLKEIRALLTNTTEQELVRMTEPETPPQVEEMSRDFVGPSRPPVVLSFFSGIGMLDLGFEAGGIDVVFVNEIRHEFLEGNRFARQQMGRPTPRFGYSLESAEVFLTKPESDSLNLIVRTLRSEGHPVGFIAGPPCQDFSTAGKNLGQGGANGRLTQTYVDLITTHMPDFFLFENVQGLVINHRKYLLDIVSQWENAGYEVSASLLNSMEFGVAQDRKRLFIFGMHRHQRHGDLRRFDWHAHAKYADGAVFSVEWPKADEVISDVCAPHIPPDLTVLHWYQRNDVSNHPNGQEFFAIGLTKDLVEELPEGKARGPGFSYRRQHRCRPSPTIFFGSGGGLVHYQETRHLSPAEAMAVQSMPKEFALPEGMAISTKYKSIGNGVPFLMAKGIAESVVDTFSHE